MFGVCAREVFYVCVVLYLGRDPATGRSLVQEVLPLCIDPKENENFDTVRVWYKRNGYKKEKKYISETLTMGAHLRVFDLSRHSLEGSEVFKLQIGL
jgi:hypothetical protein